MTVPCFYDITYSYDGVGNRLTKVEDGATTTHSYDAANQIETQEDASGITTYTFDANGNTQVENAGGQLTTYTWDVENMCTGIQLPGGSRNTFMYDGDLKRSFAHDAANGIRRFVYDGENVGLETNLGGTVLKAYTHEPAGYGNLISEWYASMNRSYWYHFDALGTVERMTGLSQYPIITYVHQAFGVPQAVGGPYPTHPNRYRWVGRHGYRWEPDMSQYQVGRRRFDPPRGRWLSFDALMGVNRFVYAGNSPVVMVDPSGLLGIYHVGADWPQVDPPRDWAEAFAMFDSEPSTAVDVANAATMYSAALAVAYEPDSTLKRIGEPFNLALSPRGARGFLHYLGITASTYEIDFGKMIYDNPYMLNSIFVPEMANALMLARGLAPGAYTLSGTPTRIDSSPALINNNWFNLVGTEFTVFGRAEVNVRRNCPPAKSIRMRFTLYYKDWWFFNKHQLDSYPGRFHKVGLAAFFPMRGEFSMPYGE